MSEKRNKNRILIIVVLLLIIVGIYTFDVGINTLTRVVSDGVIIDDKELADRYEKALSSEGILYFIEETEDGQIKLTWDIKLSEKVREIEEDIIGTSKSGYVGLCLQQTKERDVLARKLIDASLEYKIRDQDDGLKCIDWNKVDDIKVQEIYPRLRDIRIAEQEAGKNL